LFIITRVAWVWLWCGNNRKMDSQIDPNLRRTFATSDDEGAIPGAQPPVREINFEVSESENLSVELERRLRHKLHRKAPKDKSHDETDPLSQNHRCRDSERMFHYSRSDYPVREWKFALPWGIPGPVVVNPLVMGLAMVWLWGLVIWSSGTFLLEFATSGALSVLFLDVSFIYWPVLHSKRV
jgi:hypothetical protein